MRLPRRFVAIPFLQFGRRRNILVPDIGENVPFEIANHPYRDPLGRETVTFVREYRIGDRALRFDATMIAHDGRRTTGKELWEERSLGSKAEWI